MFHLKGRRTAPSRKIAIPGRGDQENETSLEGSPTGLASGGGYGPSSEEEAGMSSGRLPGRPDGLAPGLVPAAPARPFRCRAPSPCSPRPPPLTCSSATSSRHGAALPIFRAITSRSGLTTGTDTGGCTLTSIGFARARRHAARRDSLAGLVGNAAYMARIARQGAVAPCLVSGLQIPNEEKVA